MKTIVVFPFYPVQISKLELESIFVCGINTTIIDVDVHKFLL